MVKGKPHPSFIWNQYNVDIHAIYEKRISHLDENITHLTKCKMGWGEDKFTLMTGSDVRGRGIFPRCLDSFATQRVQWSTGQSNRATE